MSLTCYIFSFCCLVLFCFILLRQPTQDPPEELRTRDFRRELEERERAAAREKTRERGPRGFFAFNIGYFNASILHFYLFLQIFLFFTLSLRNWLDHCPGSNFPEHTTSSSSSSSKRPRLDQIPAANLDADDPLTDVRARFATHKWTFSIVEQGLIPVTNVWW